jgi:hypothetical protein
MGSDTVARRTVRRAITRMTFPAALSRTKTTFVAFLLATFTRKVSPG